MSTLTIISWLICLAYQFWISMLFMSWVRKQTPVKKNNNASKSISLIIAIRNESENLPKLLKSIKQLDYPHHLFEVIFIDDHSEDNSNDIIEEFNKSCPSINIKYRMLEAAISGKKAALNQAYKQAENDLIVTTDGDTQLPKEWLKKTADIFQNTKTMMALGGIKINKSISFIGNFQALELLSLIASGAGAARLNHPIMSNGANIAFRKNILTIINNEALKPNIPSGDDMFLMLETKKKFGAKSIVFLKDIAHFVNTAPITNWKDLINQRIRWVSKSNHYKDPFLITTSWIVFLQNLLIALLVFISVFFPVIFQILGPIWLLKVILDYIFLYNASQFTSQKYLMKNYFLMALIYPFFISYTAIMGQFSSFKWKGRFY